MENVFKVFLCAVVASCPALCWADLNSAQAAFDRKDYPVAAKEFRILAEQGNPQAQYMLGRMYYQGIYGIKRDEVESVRWQQKAAQQGFVYAEFDLAVSYENGSGVKQDNAMAFQWYRKAAEAGHPQAQRKLGDTYAYGGLEVKVDPKEALRWYQLAAEGGDASTFETLAVKYISGDLGEKNYYKAYVWATLALAAYKHHNDHALKARDLAEKELTPAEIAKAQKEAHAWKPRGNLRGTFIFPGIKQEGAASK